MGALTDAEREERRAYLGGTDAAALAGVNPPGWAQPIDVYLEKVGEDQPRRSTRTMATGHLMEGAVAALFTEATGIRLRRPARPVRSRRYPWAGGHLDRWAGDGAVFEAKWSMTKEGWGESLPLDGTPEAPTLIPGPRDEQYRPIIPPHYMVQVQHYLAATDRPLAYVAALLGWGDFRWYAVWRDEAVIGTLMQLEEAFWRDHVLARVPPEPDGSEAYGRQLRRRYAVSDGQERVATPEEQATVAELRAAQLRLELAEREVARLEQRLQDGMKLTERLIAPDGVITWATTKPRLRVEWEELVAAILREQAVLLQAEGAPVEWPTTKKAVAEHVRRVALAYGHAHEEPGTRRFTAKFASDEEEAPDAATADE
jgi:predicted phage-related endonuclease